jgi:membrane protease subunit (stomatin/prohibitin family)
MRSFLLVRIKNYLASYIKQDKISIFEIDEHLLAISTKLHEQFIPDFIEYGIMMEKFFITTIVKPEDDSNYMRFKDLYFRKFAEIAEARLMQERELIEQETHKKRLIMEAEGIAKKRELEGFTYQAERGFDVAETVAANEAVGNMANTGIGLGMMTGIGMGVGGAVGGVVGGMMQDTMDSAISKPKQASQQGSVQCVKCGNTLPNNAKFCLECGQQVVIKDEVICPSCNTMTPLGKFCLECGATMNKPCLSCGVLVPAKSKFCLECGYKLEERMNA